MGLGIYVPKAGPQSSFLPKSPLRPFLLQAGAEEDAVVGWLLVGEVEVVVVGEDLLAVLVVAAVLLSLLLTALDLDLVARLFNKSFGMIPETDGAAVVDGIAKVG